MVTYWSTYPGTSSSTVTLVPRYVTVSSALFASTNHLSTSTLFVSAYDQTASGNWWISDDNQTIIFASQTLSINPLIREIEWPAPAQPRQERPAIVRAPAAPAIIRSRASQERRERREQAYAARQAEVERALRAQREIERRAAAEAARERYAEAERERARRTAEAEQARIQAAAVANAARTAAEVRARELLLSHLTPEQRASIEANGWFVVEGGLSRKRYQIHLNRVAGNIHEMVGQAPVARLCCHCDSVIPPSDHHLAQKLMLEHREDEFLRIANRTPLQ